MNNCKEAEDTQALDPGDKSDMEIDIITNGNTNLEDTHDENEQFPVVSKSTSEIDTDMEDLQRTETEGVDGAASTSVLNDEDESESGAQGAENEEDQFTGTDDEADSILSEGLSAANEMDQDMETFHSGNVTSMSEFSDSSDDDMGEYSCRICDHDFADVTSLFSHYETHCSIESSSARPSSHSTVLFGDPVENTSMKQWPSRFRAVAQENPTPFAVVPSSSVEENGLELEDSETEIEQSDRDAEDEDDDSPPILTPMAPLLPCNSNGYTEAKSQRQKYTCPHCLKRFQRSDHFCQHLANHHRSKSSFQCKICGQKFRVLITLRRHMMSHEEVKPYQCSACQQRFHRADLLQRHHEAPCEHKEGTDHRRKCPMCSQTFPNDVSFLEHQRQVHAGFQHQKIILRCRFATCRTIYSTLTELLDHYKGQHGGERLLEAARALGTSQPARPPLILNGHNTIGTSEVKSATLPPIAAKKKPGATIPTAQRGLAGTTECRMCFQFFQSLSDRNQHESSVHYIDDPTTTLQCKYSDCQKILGAKNWLARHIREHRERIDRGEESALDHEAVTGKRKRARVTTVVPRIQVPNVVEVDEEDEEEPWDCRLCDEKFLEESDRAGHENEIHEIDNFQIDFICKHCRKPVGNFPSLLIHLEKAHKKLFPEGSLKNGDVPVSARAKDDPKKGNGKVRFPCRHCDRTFGTQMSRLQHEYDSHQTKDAMDSYFPCKVCAKVMTLKSLRKHLVSIHSMGNSVLVDSVAKQRSVPLGGAAVKPLGSKSSVTKKSDSERGSGSGSWMCRLCFERFDEMRQRETHEHAVHFTNSVNASYVCKFSDCALTCTTFRELIKHLRGTHGETTVPKGQQKLPTPSLTQYKQH